ncbi:MAG: DinB family protein [Cyclobacteriaceae bacterium]
MKTTLLFFLLAITSTTVMAQKSKLSDHERRLAVDLLTETQNILLATLKDVDDKMWSYKPDADSWSVAGCLEHIVFAESQLTLKVMKMIEGEPQPDIDLSSEDGLVIANVTDRSKKVKTIPPLVPSGRWTSKQEMIDELNRSREKLIEFTQTTKANLRGFAAETPVGLRDAYQHLLVIASHGLRHTNQIKSIIAQYEGVSSESD